MRALCGTGAETHTRWDWRFWAVGIHYALSNTRFIKSFLADTEFISSTCPDDDGCTTMTATAMMMMMMMTARFTTRDATTTRAK